MIRKLFGSKKQKNCSASTAKERLQIIVAHQRNELMPNSHRISSHLLAELKDEIIEVVKKYIALSEQNIRDIDLKVEDNNRNSTIEVNIPFN